jgi:hypothetical protein
MSKKYWAEKIKYPKTGQIKSSCGHEVFTKTQLMESDFEKQVLANVLR